LNCAAQDFASIPRRAGQLVTDLGGVERLSEGQKQMARRCAMLSVECEKMESAAVAGLPFDVDRYGLLTDRLGRAFQRLGLRRIAHDVTPDLGVYLTATTGWGRPRTASPGSPLPQPNRPATPTVSIGEHDAFRHNAPGSER
jgi:hypothetical protein